jgi:PAS domain S-box-containing protein
MPYIAMDRISRGLRWAGGALLLAGIALVVVAIGWTQTADALITGSTIAALAFGLPGLLAFALAYWLENAAERLERSPAGASNADGTEPAPPHANPFHAPATGYAAAVAAVVVMWGTRAALDGYLGQRDPFITFYLAIAVAAWLGGFGPAALATLLSLLVAWFFYLPPAMSFRIGDPGSAIALGLFTFVCLGIGAITVALRTSLSRAHQLAAEAPRQALLLRECEQRLKVLAEIAPVLIRMHDATKACVYCNPMWLQYTGRTLDHELGQGWSGGVHPDDLDRCLTAFETAFDQKAPFSMDYRLRDAGGAYRVVRDTGAARFDTEGAFAGYVNACMDISEPVAAQLTGGPRDEAGGTALGP